MNKNSLNKAKLLRILLLLLLGYKQEPITTLTVIFRHPRGTRIGISAVDYTVWYNA